MVLFLIRLDDRSNASIVGVINEDLHRDLPYIELFILAFILKRIPLAYGFPPSCICLSASFLSAWFI